MKNVFAFVVLFAAITSTIAGAQDVVTIVDTSGRVEVLEPGAAWREAEVGMQISTGSTISTGFQSSAVLQAGEASLEVKPLTRMRVDELVTRGGVQNTDLFLRVGRVRAEVRSAEGLRHDFQLRSPVSTAAVRGTTFEYSGTELEVTDGEVSYSNKYGTPTVVSQGEKSKTSGTNTPSSGESGKQVQVAVVPRITSGVGGDDSLAGGLGGEDSDDLFGSVEVRATYLGC